MGPRVNRLRPRWRRARTGEAGWNCELLVVRGTVVAQLDGLTAGYYGHVLDQRTGNMGEDRRRARRHLRRRVLASRSGIIKFLTEATNVGH